MSENINTWKLRRNGEALCQILTFTPALEPRKIVSKALNGTLYVQTVGNPVKKAAVELFALREELDAVNLAEAEGALLQLTYRNTEWHGYIEAAPDWKIGVAGMAYTATVTFLKEVDT